MADPVASALAAWDRRVGAKIAAAVKAARDHAANARTEALKQTPDGRSSLLRINANPSYKAALSRLDELWGWLAGPSEVSLIGAVRDAREEFYRAAYRAQHPRVPDEYRARPTDEPTVPQVRAVRAAAVHGYDPRKLLETPVRRAKLTLKATLELAARKGVNRADGTDRLDAWERRTATSLVGTARTLLTDSAAYTETQALLDLVKPELIEE